MFITMLLVANNLVCVDTVILLIEIRLATNVENLVKFIFTQQQQSGMIKHDDILYHVSVKYHQFDCL